MTEKFTQYDTADYLKTDEDIAAYFDAVLEENDAQLAVQALGVIARAKGMTQVAQEAELGRTSLYKALSSKGNPEFETVFKVIRALGLQLHASLPSAHP